jgi:dGTPase
MLADLALWKDAETLRRPFDLESRDRCETIGSSVVRTQTIGALLNALITDLIEETSRRIEVDPPDSLAALRTRPDPLVGFSTGIDFSKRELKSFLSTNFYHHPHVLRRTRKAEWIVGDLFRTYRDDAKLLPDHVRARFGREGELRAISDYIAGMTDRFAMDEHKRLLDPHSPI